MYIRLYNVYYIVDYIMYSNLAMCNIYVIFPKEFSSSDSLKTWPTIHQSFYDLCYQYATLNSQPYVLPLGSHLYSLGVLKVQSFVYIKYIFIYKFVYTLFFNDQISTL